MTLLLLVRRGRWKIVFDPDFTSARKLKAAKRAGSFKKLEEAKRARAEVQAAGQAQGSQKRTLSGARGAAEGGQEKGLGVESPGPGMEVDEDPKENAGKHVSNIMSYAVGDEVYEVDVSGVIKDQLGKCAKPEDFTLEDLEFFQELQEKHRAPNNLDPKRIDPKQWPEVMIDSVCGQKSVIQKVKDG